MVSQINVVRNFLLEKHHREHARKNIGFHEKSLCESALWKILLGKGFLKNPLGTILLVKPHRKKVR